MPKWLKFGYIPIGENDNCHTFKIKLLETVIKQSISYKILSSKNVKTDHWPFDISNSVPFLKKKFGHSYSRSWEGDMLTMNMLLRALPLGALSPPIDMIVLVSRASGWKGNVVLFLLAGVLARSLVHICKFTVIVRPEYWYRGRFKYQTTFFLIAHRPHSGMQSSNVLFTSTKQGRKILLTPLALS